MFTFNLDVFQMAESRGMRASVTLMIMDPPSASEKRSYQKRSSSSISLRDKNIWPEGETKPWKDDLIMSPPYVVCRLNIWKKIFRVINVSFFPISWSLKEAQINDSIPGFVYVIDSREAYTWSCFPRKASVSRESFPDFWFVLTQHGFASVCANVKQWMRYYMKWYSF